MVTSSNWLPEMPHQWVPVHAASTRSLRVVDPAFAVAHESHIRFGIELALAAREEKAFEAQLEHFLEANLDALRRRIASSSLPETSLSGLVEALTMGAAVAQVEKQHNQYRPKTTHPVIHALLTTVQFPLLDEGGLTAAVALQAAYVGWRGGLPPDATLAPD